MSLEGQITLAGEPLFSVLLADSGHRGGPAVEVYFPQSTSNMKKICEEPECNKVYSLLLRHLYSIRNDSHVAYIATI